MTYKFKWKKSIFSNTTYIYSNNKLVGNLVDRMFVNAKAEINTTKYIFEGRPYSRNYDILDKKTGNIVGEIDAYSSKKSIIILNLITKERFEYKDDGSWFINNWTISNSKNQIALSAGFQREGEIISEFNDDLAIIIGLFLNRTYWQINLIIILIIILPCLLILLNK